MKLFTDFGFWMAQLAILFYEWEKDNTTVYKPENPSLELSLLPAMFETGMTPQEAFDTLTATDMREMTVLQYNIHNCYAFLALSKTSDARIVAVLAVEENGRPVVIKAAKSTFGEMERVARVAADQMKTAIAKGAVNADSTS